MNFTNQIKKCLYCHFRFALAFLCFAKVVLLNMKCTVVYTVIIIKAVITEGAILYRLNEGDLGN